MEPISGIVGGDHRHVRRQGGVQRLGRAAGRCAPRHDHAGDLTGRVHAGIGPPGDGELVPPSRVDDIERFPQRSLDRALARLTRPAVEPAAVVLECELEGSHGRSF